MAIKGKIYDEERMTKKKKTKERTNETEPGEFRTPKFLLLVCVMRRSSRSFSPAHKDPRMPPVCVCVSVCVWFLPIEEKSGETVEREREIGA